MEGIILALDQGTSGLKASLFKKDGNILSSISKGYPTYYEGQYGVEQECQDWWEATLEAIKELLEKSRISASDIEAIGVDGTSWALIPVDIEGKPLRRALIWMDRRAQTEATELAKLAGKERLEHFSGNPVDASYVTPKIRWFQKHEPDLYKKTSYFLTSNAFLAYKLTGVFSQDRSQGYGFHFFDIQKAEFDTYMAQELGCDIHQIPPMYECHETVGIVSRQAASLSGLIEGTPVVAGGLDAACCTLGAGVIHPGQIQEQGGQAGGMSICIGQAKMHPRLILGCHVVPGYWLLQGGTTGGGGTMNWFDRELATYEHILGQEKNESSFAIMSEEAEKISPGSDGLLFLPYMKGERSPLWNSGAKGVYYGLSYEKTRAHMIRSMMEGVAYSLRHNLDTALEVNIQEEGLISVGGCANSHVWMQVKSDVTNQKIQVPYADQATSLGAALLAGVGVGIYKDFEEAVLKTVRIKKTYIPNPSHVKLYDTYYHTYLKLSKLMNEYMFEHL